ncbi:Transcription factor TGA4-like protein [Drosera capensis]
MSRRMHMYEPFHQMNTWVGGYRDFEYPDFSPSTIVEPEEKMNQLEDVSHGLPTSLNKYYQEDKYNEEVSKPADKVQRRLAQNREAARKSRLRKKAYVQQLESSRIKLIQLEQELDRARQRGTCSDGMIDHLPFSGHRSSGIVAFEIEYGRWVEEQNRQTSELKSVLHENVNVTDAELRVLVDGVMSHYFELFHLKSAAAKSDIFYLMSGMWRTSAERFFLWIGGFRPSELLKVLLPQLEPFTDQQLLDVYNLTQSCQQAEDAFSQGMDKLQQNLAEAVAAGRFGEGSFAPQMTDAIERLEALVSFLDQADHLRKEALQQMHRILTTRQAARGLLALGEYFQRLRALSSLWAGRAHDTA